MSTPTVGESTAPTSTSTPRQTIVPGGTARDSTGRLGGYREWNRLQDGMERFHSHFKWEYKNTYDNAMGGFISQGMQLDRFLQEAMQLANHLDMHHRIEEAYIFPLLAKKNPDFADMGRKSGGKSGEHIRKHRLIHKGLDGYQDYINSVKANPASYDGSKLRAIMDGFHDVLFEHLAEEVEDLGAQSMLDHGFTLNELTKFPM